MPSESRRPRLRHEHQLFGVGVERGVNQLVGDVRPVELGSVDVVHALCHGVAEDVQRLEAGGLACLLHVTTRPGRPEGTPFAGRS
jgi:hypothetical protein